MTFRWSGVGVLGLQKISDYLMTRDQTGCRIIWAFNSVQSASNFTVLLLAPIWTHPYGNIHTIIVAPPTVDKNRYKIFDVCCVSCHSFQGLLPFRDALQIYSGCTYTSYGYSLRKLWLFVKLWACHGSESDTGPGLTGALNCARSTLLCPADGAMILLKEAFLKGV